MRIGQLSSILVVSSLSLTLDYWYQVTEIIVESLGNHGITPSLILTMVIRHLIGNFVRSPYSNLLIIPLVGIELAILYQLFLAKNQWVPEKPLSNFEKQVWTFYTASFDNPATSKTWGDWAVKKHPYTDSYYQPPFEIPSSVFPQFGLYSSHNKFLIKKHMRMLARHGIDGVIVDWVPPQVDKKFVDESVKIIFKQAKKIGLSVALQIMNYPNRDCKSLNKDINYIRSNYAYNEIYLKFDGRPMIFIDDAGDMEDIQSVIPDQSRDMFFMAMIRDHNQMSLSLEDGFHGIYTFPGPETSEWSAQQSNWKSLNDNCVSRGLLFIPVVIPGYNNKRQGSYINTYIQSRMGGEYYKQAFRQASSSGASLIIIDSFNNWPKGTNIEPIVEKEDYKPTDDSWSATGGPEYYMNLTKTLISEFKASRFLFR